MLYEVITEGGVGIVDDVVLLDQVVLQHVVDQAADEGDVAAGAQLGVEVRLGRGPGGNT